MSETAIRVESLGKQYRIGKRERYRTLRDTLSDTFMAPLRWVGALARSDKAGAQSPSDLFWALKDVSFEVRRGEVIGIVGRNGAGKSTLLKILSRITEPTEGRIEIHGRVGSLLEVGTGFHPELTGRENIFLNGAILGMRRTEIANKFDEIVAFAEVEKFTDTPVKHYSSGMYMRLAFAVAAHLEPEILVIDEVLAVGDTQFQKKCLGKMSEVARQGRTVIFVSHNMVAVEHLCSEALLLDAGTVVLQASPADVVRRYLTMFEEELTGDLSLARHRGGSGDIRFQCLQVVTCTGSDFLRAGDPFSIRLGFQCSRTILNPVFSISLWSMTGVCLFAVHTSDVGFAIPGLQGSGRVDLDIRNPNLLPGRYVLHCAIGDEGDPRRYDHVTDASYVDVQDTDVYGTGKLSASDWSNVFFDCQWRLAPQTSPCS